MGSKEAYQVKKVASRACLSMGGKPVRSSEEEIRVSVDALLILSCAGWGRRAKRESPELRHEVLVRTAAASTVEAGSNAQHDGASNAEDATPVCLVSPSCAQRGVSASVDGWEGALS